VGRAAANDSFLPKAGAQRQACLLSQWNGKEECIWLDST